MLETRKSFATSLSTLTVSNSHSIGIVWCWVSYKKNKKKVANVCPASHICIFAASMVLTVLMYDRVKA